ncbi:MAG: hypothetical protein IJU25_03350, partial [Lachnospiraceae bacterium]|nr:hypothetical protein [Lachnospiraceae bacterium]
DLRMEISEEPREGDTVKNYTYTTDLWQRVIRLNNICRAYVNSEFAKNMGKAFIRPPVMRTNAILKNRNFRQCLALWEFIESYERTGCELMVHEDLETLDARYVEELYQNAALQYSIFRYQVRNAFEPEKTLANGSTEAPLTPKITEELKELQSSDFDVTLERNLPMPGDFGMEPKLTEHDWDLLEAIEIALEAAGLDPHPLDRDIEPTVDLEEPPQEEIEEEIVEEKPEAEGPKPLGLQLTMDQWRSLLLRNAISTGLITAAATLAAGVAIGKMDSGYAEAALVTEAERMIAASPLPRVIPEAILQMRLYRLIGLEIEALRADYEKTLKEIALYSDILENRSSMTREIIKDLKAFKKTYARDRRTTIDNIAEVAVVEKPLVQIDVAVLIDRFAYARCVDMATYERNKEAANKETKHVILCKNTDRLGIFTNTGQLQIVKVTDIPMGRFRDKGQPLDNISNFDSAKEDPLMIACIEQLVGRKVLFVTETAMVKFVDGLAFDVAKRTTAATKLTPDDQVILVEQCRDGDTIVMQSKEQMFLRIEVSDIPEKKKAAIGVRGMRLSDSDRLKKAYLINGESSHSVTVSGKKVVLNRLRIGKRDTKGVKR